MLTRIGSWPGGISDGIHRLNPITPSPVTHTVHTVGAGSLKEKRRARALYTVTGTLKVHVARQFLKVSKGLPGQP